MANGSGNANAAALTDRQKNDLKWICEHYFTSLYALIDSNRVYLNQGITWSIGIISAVMIFALTYISPLQDVRDASGTVTGRTLSAILQNITDADILLLTAVLSVSFAFVSNFMSRSIKGYLNLRRYVGLYSRCLPVASGKEECTPEVLRQIIEQIDKYDTRFSPPISLRNAVWEMCSGLGYGLFFGIIFVMDMIAVFSWYDIQRTMCSSVFWLICFSGPIWLIVELLLLRFASNYFRYGDTEVHRLR